MLNTAFVPTKKSLCLRISSPHNRRATIHLHRNVCWFREPIKDRKIARENRIFRMLQVEIFHIKILERHVNVIQLRINAPVRCRCRISSSRSFTIMTAGFLQLIRNVHQWSFVCLLRKISSAMLQSFSGRYISVTRMLNVINRINAPTRAPILIGQNFTIISNPIVVDQPTSIISCFSHHLHRSLIINIKSISETSIPFPQQSASSCFHWSSFCHWLFVTLVKSIRVSSVTTTPGHSVSGPGLRPNP